MRLWLSPGFVGLFPRLDLRAIISCDLFAWKSTLGMESSLFSIMYRCVHACMFAHACHISAPVSIHIEILCVHITMCTHKHMYCMQS